MNYSLPVCIMRHAFAALLALFFFSSNSFAQTDDVNLSSRNYKPDKGGDCTTCTCICIQGSIDFSNVHESVAGYPGVYSAPGYKTKVGFNFGVFATHPIMTIGPGNLAARAGLEFIQKGRKYSEDGVKETIGLNYIELPIDALFQYPVMDNNTVFAGFGPYFAYGIGGKDKYDDGTTTTTQNSFGGDNGAKRFDFGLQFIAGFRLSCMASISLSYDLGLLNIAKKDNNTTYSYHEKNGVFGVNLSYCLGGLMSK